MLEGRAGVFQNVKSTEFVGIPVLEVCEFLNAFECVEDVTMEGVAEVLVEWEEERKRRKREEEERRRKEAEEAAKRRVVISCKRDWDCVDKRVGALEVSNRCCNEVGLKELDLRGFVNLRELKVGDECFEYTKKVNICGLRELERVCIGSKSFRREG